MKRKQTTALILAALITASMAGCQAGSAQTETAQSAVTAEVLSEQTALAEKVPVEEMKTVKPPADGWTHEQLSEVIYLCGEPLTLPCSLEDLPDDFEIGKIESQIKNGKLSDYITINGDKSNFYMAQLLLNGDVAGFAYYYEDQKDKIVFSIGIAPYLDRTVLVMNGAAQNAPFSNVKEALGESFVQKSVDFNIIEYKIANPEYPEEYIEMMYIDDDEEIIASAYSLFEIKKND